MAAGRDVVTPELAAILAKIVAAAPAGRRALLAIDGIGASGKTEFAEALARGVVTRSVVLLHVDDFFNPSEIRHARGRHSPTGFWLDSYNYHALTTLTLDPLLPSGDGWYRPCSFDRRSGRPIDPEPVRAADDALVVVEGTFLHRDTVLHYWDLSVFLDVPFDVAARRMVARTGAATGLDEALRRRYFGAQRLYFEQARPVERATLVVDNSDFTRPAIIEPPLGSPGICGG